MQDAGVGYGENEQSLLAAHHPGRHRNGCSAAHDDRYSDADYNTGAWHRSSALPFRRRDR